MSFQASRAVDVGDQRLAQVCGQLVHDAAGDSLAAHRAMVGDSGAAACETPRMGNVRPLGRRWGAVIPTVVLFVLAFAPNAGATFSGENGRIFYVAGSFTASSTVMSVCPNGGHVKTVMPLAILVTPSPDGSKIAYNKIKLTGSGLYDFEDDGIWIADADGSNPVQITDSYYSDVAPSWSPDGTKLTFRRHVYYDGPNRR